MIIVPTTENKFRFYKGRPELIKNPKDIKFFNEHSFFKKVEKIKEEKVELKVEKIDKPKENVDFIPYDKEALESMKKSELKKILEEVKPGRSCPVKRENIIKEILCQDQ